MNNQITKMHIEAEKQFSFIKGVLVGILIIGLPVIICLIENL